MTSLIEFTPYYYEFCRYNELATKQQEKCNLGMESYLGSVPDPLMEHVELYDVVERSFAGFSQIVHDVYYGWTPRHPYWEKMKTGKVSRQREIIAKDWTGKILDLEEFLYILILHRVTGSGINYAYKPSGYHNSLLMHLHQCHNGDNVISMDKMVNFVKNYPSTFMTSVGYQFPRFPKPIDNQYRIGGVYYLCEFAPRLANDLSEFLQSQIPHKVGIPTSLTFRKLLDWMLNWNLENGLSRYIFQYAAVAADIADWLPEYIDRTSMFVYGTNAVNCMAFMGKSTKLKGQDLLDGIIEQAVKDTGGHPYNIEDVFCDTVRYLENYCKPGADYSHLDLDNLWNTSKIIHPYGRQKHMLELGLVDSFNNLTHHPTGDTIISKHGISPHEYVQKVKEHYGSKKSFTTH
jgi:hypothetical protein